MKTKLSLLILLCISITGCDQQYTKRPAEKYRCNAEQLILVEIEMKLCLTTSYFSSACYDIAKETICTEIKGDHHVN